MNSLINWFNEHFSRSLPIEQEQGQQYHLVRLPSDHLLWLSEEHYELVDGGHAILWMMDGSVEIVPILQAIRLIEADYENIFLWTTEVEYQRSSPEVPEGSNGWPYSAMSIRDMNQHQMRNGPGPNKKRDIDIHVPYDPRLGF